MKLSKNLIKPENFDRINDLIEFIISLHPYGFLVLLGTCPPPDSNEVHEMFSSQRDPLPSDYKATQKQNFTRAEAIVADYEYFTKSVKLAGGWAHINQVANDFIKLDPLMWNVAADHVKYISIPGSRCKSKLKHVADKNKISTRTVIRYRKLFPQVLSMMILLPDAEKYYLGL